MYTKEECKEALRSAANEIGKPPTVREYREMYNEPTVATLQNKFGSWNQAKEAAGIKTFERNKILKKPDSVKVSDEEWKNMENSKRRRIYYKAKFAEIKYQSGCVECGYDNDHRALDFHHKNPEEKKFRINKVFSGTINKEQVQKALTEIEKCEVLCANCHRQKEPESAPIRLD